ncbi:flagellin N-terminal helical domain-containing protein [Jonesia denitrificans]|uniref:Flagellin n=1 Tax=Jonesia denitrificans (strain ATCC 14870 / DSM 20603 / BCRC 15368 / CIP 55.134 / JCM 11481 / NBRC 15587 / NCTC 10816 / Prevot 55134) TaxID=471856 RepID=C7R0K9_JONDD|nr:flagellin [Jonesia denitrificans]ACV09673.1 flagellin domain protein [Jonesia denitrificans DSM 20603]ASE09110.1 flagellin [Jonesia denitrificans]QXB43654.1 flagellin [Jonesia denitrificans]SQH22196.1 Flagellin [Jonesia denitrificans]
MGLSINQNIAAVNSYRNLANTQNDLSKSLEKLSSGFRINRAADDAAGLAISEGLRSQVGGLKVAARNAQDGISVVQTAEGALTETHAILQRLRDLAVQGANDSNNTEARDNIKTEADSLIKELGRIGESTNFNGTKLLSGDVDSGTTGAQTTLNFQVGADGDANSRITVNLANANVVGVATALGYDTATGNVNATAFDVTDHASSQATITAVNAQIESVSTARAELGAYQNRFEHTIKNINVAVENLSASESRIRDTDMAQEMVQFTRAQILSQAGTAMLAQANQIPQGVLSLLR